MAHDVDHAHRAVDYLIKQLCEHQDNIITLCSLADEPVEETLAKTCSRFLERRAFEDHQIEFNFNGQSHGTSNT